MQSVLFFIIALALCAGCGKSTAEKDKIPPVVQISSPLNGQSFSPGQSIIISGTITDDQYIAETHIHVSNRNTGELLMDVHLYPGGKTGNFNQPVSATAGIDYKIQVIAKDRAVNETRGTVEVSCN
ncbi:MAG: hypothetical protein HYZ15_02615 [Sphingobacteriales bacterium]|nr:hypothetical protein [Sphingobacteriales bacterium]